MRRIIYLLAIIVTIAACRKSTEQPDIKKVAVFNGVASMRTAGTADSDKAFICLDTANKMISSYLNSINYLNNDTEIRSMIIDADALRSYLNSTAGHGISQMKIIFAHKLDYINSGGKDRRCDYRASALTFILAGYNDDGNYIYYKNNEVPDHSTPCPASCPTGGSAAENLLSL